MTRTPLLLLLVASVAHANVWDRAIEKGSPDPSKDVYDDQLRRGDEYAMQANARGSASLQTIKQNVANAALAYRAASTARPNEGEPYYRLGRLLYSFYFECNDQLLRSSTNVSLLCNPDPRAFDRKRAQEVIDAWDAFEAHAPLDPRLSVELGETEVLFKRAILHTKFATQAHLEAAAKDYERMLAREDPGEGIDERVLGNLAETYMMIGRLDDAIETYLLAVRSAQETSTVYGLAVALDRDERGAQAKDAIESLGLGQMDLFRQRVTRGDTFFVPSGEEYYYFALADETFGRDDEAIEYWQLYIKSNAHPEFQPRAKSHLDQLRAKKRHRIAPPALDPPWEIFR